MAISTDATIDFFGTEDTVTVAGGTSVVADDSFSAASDVVAGGWINDDDADGASIVLTWQYPSGTINADGIHLYCRRMNIDGTSDEPQPDSGYNHKYLGTFPTDTNKGAATNDSVAIDIPLLNNYSSQVYEFYIENDCGVAMSAGWTLKITPKAKGPHA